MERELTSEQERLLLLQESTSFVDLTAEEQSFVLRFITQNEFDQVHAMLKESKNSYAIPEPKQLIVKPRKSAPVLAFILPFSTAAAAAILTFVFLSKETVVFKEIEKPVYLTADTVFIQKELRDTIVKRIYIQSKKTKNETPTPVFSIEMSPQGRSQEELPPISLIDLKNKGQSATHDETLGLIDGRSF